jgi:hypothetical protein
MHASLIPVGRHHIPVNYLPADDPAMRRIRVKGAWLIAGACA